MKSGTFRGGIHPYEGKELSEQKSIQRLLPAKAEMVYPLSQHIGVPAKPLVKKGDAVLVGQKIGELQGAVSACVISSVSGKVKAVEPRRMTNGEKALSVIVENDKNYTKLDGIGEKRDYTALSKEEIRTMIREAGIVGLGGAGFPTHIKLTPPKEEEIDYIIVNGAECEPYLTSDYRIMMEEPEHLITGLKVMLQLFDRAKGVIAIESNKPEAIALLKDLTKAEPRIEVCTLKTKYPQGGERFLIKAVTGRKINSSMIPAQAGVIVDNADTVVSIYYAVCCSTPLLRRIITVTGDAIANPQNFSVLLGTSYEELLEAAGGFAKQPEKILSGGPMMGQALFDLNVPVTKTSSALTCFTKDPVAAMKPSACIRCGRCAQVCPGHIVPQMLMKAARQKDLTQFEALNGMECCECGCCAYICPAKIPLTQAFREMRKSVMETRKKG